MGPLGTDALIEHAEDLDELLGDVRNATDPVAALARRDIPPTAAAHLVGLLSDELTADATVTGRSRTPGIRAALQYYGTDVRRVQDPDYWVKRALGPAVRAVAAGFDVYFSDIRFPNEVAGARRLGFHVVRLLISPQTQRARLLERDGLEPDPEAVNHPSETALDDYDGFDQVLDNNGTVDAAVSRILAALSHRAST